MNIGLFFLVFGVFSGRMGKVGKVLLGVEMMSSCVSGWFDEVS